MKTKTYFTSLIPQSVDASELCLKEVRILSYLSSIVLSMSGMDDMQNYQMYCNVTNQHLNKIASTDNAAALIQSLKQKDIIEVNDKYSAGHFSKGYRYCIEHWDCIKKGQMNTDALMPFKPKKIQRGSFVNKTFDDEILQKCHNNYADVEMADDWYESLKYCKDGVTLVDYYEYVKCEPFAKQIIGGNVSTMSRPSKSRVYHPLIVMNKKARKSITVNGKKPLYVDVKSCHAALLLNFCEDAEWRNIIETQDVYAAINPDARKYSRDDIKMMFQQAISYYEDDRMQSVVRQMRDKLKCFKIWNALETLFETCKQDNTTVQNILQNLEASLFVEYFAKCETWCLPMHDGLLVDEHFDLKHLNDFVAAKLGFELQLCIV